MRGVMKRLAAAAAVVEVVAAAGAAVAPAAAVGPEDDAGECKLESGDFEAKDLDST